MARFAAKPKTGTVNAGKRILRYLRTTMYRGIEYTKENEEGFKETYGKVLETQKNKQLTDPVAFCD